MGKENDKEEERGEPKRKETKLKVCKGGLYHSSTRKSKSKDPFCLGFSGTYHRDLGARDEPEAAPEKRTYNISYFKYGCIGYSAHLEKDDPWQAKRHEPAVCLGFELIVRNWSDRAPAHVHSKQVVEVQSSHSRSDETSPTVKPSPSPSSDFQKRLARNLVVVASGVGNSAIDIGNRVKNRLINAINPFGKRDD